MKLEIQSVKFRNFLSYGSVFQEVPFLPGVNVVLGKDMLTGRSNGSGKSSFLETIPFALFGKTHKEIKKEQLINWRSRKHCEVILNFKKGENEYSILRAIKPDNFEIYEDDRLIDKPASVRDYQVVLDEILGQKFNTFGSLLHSNINSSNRILNMRKPEKRKFIEDVFGLEVYSILNDRARLKINGFETKISDLNKNIEHNNVTIESAERRIAELNEKLKRFGTSSIELRDTKIELQELEEKHPNIQEEVDRNSAILTQISTDINEKSDLSKNIEFKVKAVNRWIKEAHYKLIDIESSEINRKAYLNFCKENGSPKEILKSIETLEKKKTMHNFSKPSYRL